MGNESEVFNRKMHWKSFTIKYILQFFQHRNERISENHLLLEII